MKLFFITITVLVFITICQAWKAPGCDGDARLNIKDNAYYCTAKPCNHIGHCPSGQIPKWETHQGFSRACWCDKKISDEDAKKELGKECFRYLSQCDRGSNYAESCNYARSICDKSEDTQELSNIIRVTPQRISQMSREERLMEAINEIQNDTGFTQKELSQKYGVSESELSKKKNNLSFKPRGRYLTEAEELEMIKMVEESNTKNIPITKENILNWVVGKVYDKYGYTMSRHPGRDWWTKLKQKHPILKLRKVKFQDEARLKAEKEADIQGFIKSVHKVIVENQIQPKNVINSDEKGVLFTKMNQKVAIIDGGNKFETVKPRFPKQSQSQHFTMIGTITASGHALPPYNVLQIPKRVKWEHMQNSNYGVIIANESGYVTQEIKKEYVEWLLGQFKKTDKKLLLVDNHISNYFFDEKKLCDENNLIIMTFPSNLTHILQPLDLVLFSSFSQHLSNLLRDGLKDNPKFKVNDKHYQMLTYHAWSSSFNSSNIRMSWIKSAEKLYLKGNRYSREQRDCSGKCSSHDPKRTGYSNER
ncbi:hypothetical protein PPL_08759 [Heterostelium album PN500]|uniref:DDE-1 domain-containing protein n=1 Tax=Heterostelium pallidum (strain ATCC 26659 / Pp 5 / PN500) TaxID=670386 RepID=D3BJN1_HETP5|nr:hypothetical protein PPL_08759 [Heterostelium album PN500]EFA78111.1 hypothetical protein PPL_08759 [Heterostelium album PN500]|eukprot:XP_020430237.1 hypothetical protein PPL_08759 [Heterostelium album PN500]